MDNSFQRRGSTSNSQVGQDFENKAKSFFKKQGTDLSSSFPLPIGIGTKKSHKFDLGNSKVIVECKSHRWTEGNNVPSAKITTWDQAMFFFYVSPPGYRKILFVLRDFSQKWGETLAEYYVRTNSHLIPPEVEVWEYDELQNSAREVPVKNG